MFVRERSELKTVERRISQLEDRHSPSSELTAILRLIVALQAVAQVVEEERMRHV